MRIVAAVDSQSYSAAIISEVAKLAANTWADITILGVQSAADSAALDPELESRMWQYREDFLKHFSEGELPYGEWSGSGEFSYIDRGIWELSCPMPPTASRKKLQIRIRVGDAAREILQEAGEQQCDLLIMGCTKGLDSQWLGEIDLPRRVAQKAEHSVLIIKERQAPDTIACCLDQLHVSQASLEMINQLVTLHQAELKIVGLTRVAAAAGQEDLESKMAEVLKYYADRQINPWIKMVRLEDIEEFVAQASRQGMVALWMGKKSLLGKIFSGDLIGKLVSSSQSSVLILR